jgi:BASS family bile acid:Na+ symporter
VAAAALALNIAAMAISFSVSSVAGLDRRQVTAIALELGIHNSALAIAIGTSLSDDVAVPAAVYASFMLFTGGAFAWAMGRRNRVPAEA